MLPPYSPKTSTFKNIYHPRMVCSEPRKTSIIEEEFDNNIFIYL